MKLVLPTYCGECLAYTRSTWHGANDGTSGTTVSCELLECIPRRSEEQNAIAYNRLHPDCPLRNNKMVRK